MTTARPVTPELQATARDLPLFSALSPEQAEDLFGMCQILWLSPEELLFREGDDSDGLFIVVSGRIRLTCRGEGDVDVEVGAVREGAILGEMGVLDPAPRSASARAGGNAVVLRLPVEGLEKLITKGHPAARTVLRQISAQVCLRLRTLDRRLDQALVHDEDVDDPDTLEAGRLRRLWEALWLEK